MKRYLSLFLILTASFSSCKKDNLIGLEVQPPGDQPQIDYIDTTTVLSTAIRESAENSKYLRYNLLGSFNDPEFGKTEASIFSQFLLPTAITDFGASSVLDSVVLSLAYNTAYGNLQSTQEVSVYELTSSLLADSSYKSSISEDGYINNLFPIVNTLITPKPSDSVLVGSVKRAPQLRIKLTQDFGNKLLNATSGQLASNEAFLQFFKGLYITTRNSSPATGEGAILSFDPTKDQTRLTLYYKDKDTIAQEYSFKVSSGITVNQYKHQYTGSVKNAFNTTNSDFAYVQGTTGVRTKLTFPYLTNWSANGAIVVNKAELVVKVAAPLAYPAISKLNLVGINIEGTAVELSDASENAAYLGGTYDATNGEYRFLLTRQIQDILNGKKENYGLYLIADDDVINAQRVVILSKGNIKLNLTTTKL